MLYQLPVVLSRLEAGFQVVNSPGLAYFFIRGDCRYWVQRNNYETLWAGEVHEGQLTHAEEQRIHDDVHYDEWTGLAGMYGDMRGTDTPFPPVVLELVNQIGCFLPSGDPSAVEIPTVVQSILSAIGAITEKLYANGTPLDGAVQVLAVEKEASLPDWENDPERFYQPAESWPFTVPLDSFVVPEFMGGPDVYGLRVNLPDAEMIRGWRDLQQEEYYYAPTLGYFTPVQAGDGPMIGLYARDVMPLENAEGQIPFGAFAPSSDE